MSADPVAPEILADQARNAPLTRPRPGHADFVGMQKYGFDEARPVLERASARETAARVALGTVAAAFLRQLGIELVSHTVSIAASRSRKAGRCRSRPTTWPSTPTRCAASTAKPPTPWWPRSTPRTRTATPSAAWSRSSPTASRRDWAATSTGIAASTRASRPR